MYLARPLVAHLEEHASPTTHRYSQNHPIDSISENCMHTSPCRSLWVHLCMGSCHIPKPQTLDMGLPHLRFCIVGDSRNCSSRPRACTAFHVRLCSLEPEPLPTVVFPFIMIRRTYRRKKTICTHQSEQSVMLHTVCSSHLGSKRNTMFGVGFSSPPMQPSNHYRARVVHPYWTRMLETDRLRIMSLNPN